jgi:diamine N-acetyltransferase
MINGKKVRLRAIEPHDLELLYKWENNTEIWPVSGTLTPFSRKVMQEFIANSREDIYSAKQLRLAIDLNGWDGTDEKTIGYIDLYDFDPSNRRAGVGILVGDLTSRRQGHGLEALKLLCDYSFEILQLHQLFCNIHANNQASLRLFESAGFSCNAELKDWALDKGSWINVMVLQKINDRPNH